MRTTSVVPALAILASIASLIQSTPCRADDAGLSADDLRWREKTGYNPQVHGTVQNSSDAHILARCPYAYYPSSNEIEVMFDLEAAMKLIESGVGDAGKKPGAPGKTLTVSVFPSGGKTKIASATFPLDSNGRGHGKFKLPTLEQGGVYRVVYEFGGATLPASRTFGRSFFPFEECLLGLEHEVYPPFTPVEVDGAKASIVGRTYTINGEGLFESVVSNGRELLARPVKIVAEMSDGRFVTWTTKSVSGKVVHPDLAEFVAEAESELGPIGATVSIEEDGCATLQLTWKPSAALKANPSMIRNLFLEMALKEDEAPLCHFVGLNSMRHNYAGEIPRGGKISWIMQPWRPARFVVDPFEGKAPESYSVWNATQQMHWGGQRWNFVPYVWFGAEERGLAWFADHTADYIHDGKEPLQECWIEPGAVTLRAYFIRQTSPAAKIADALVFDFGLQASPTKPMRSDWRGYDVPGGGGMSVVVWGGFNCSSKYPVEQDWEIVDKIMEGRKTGVVDTEFFEGKMREYGLEDAKANGEPWIKSVLYFAGREAGRKDSTNGCTVYFEEHQTNGGHPEMIEYMDEWADTTWSRYRYYNYSGHRQVPEADDAGQDTWGPEVRSANCPSYRNFVVYMANEWMRRGVGIYYDNTFPVLDYQRLHFSRTNITWSSSTWGHREYYKRVWKRGRALMAAGITPYPLHTIGHVTNCQLIPYSTWWDATLGVEAPSRWDPDPFPDLTEVKEGTGNWPFAIISTPSHGAEGETFPYTPDYLRAMECGRMAGIIPYYRHLLRGEDAFGGLGIGFGSTDDGADPAIREHRYLSDTAMGLVHEIRGGSGDGSSGNLRRMFRAFGYGTPEVQTHNYWDDKPFLSSSLPDVKWIALTRQKEPCAFVLLQSYSAEPVMAKILLDAAAGFVGALDAFTYRPVNLEKLDFEADYGTRALLLFRTKEALAKFQWPENYVTALSFENDFASGWRLHWGTRGIDIVPDTKDPANTVLRISSGHPSQNYLTTTLDRGTALSFKVRFPNAPSTVPYADTSRSLQVLFRHLNEWPKTSTLTLSLGSRGTKVDDPNYLAWLEYTCHKDGEQIPFDALTLNKIAPLPETIKLFDGDWHTVTVKIDKTVHAISVDGTPVFKGALPAFSPEGAVRIGPGWGSGTVFPYVEIDDVVMVE